MHDIKWVRGYGIINMEKAFEPKIVAFCCMWCSYTAADMAGSMRLQYPPNVYITPVPCTGRVDILYLLKAVEWGADGVFVSGCELGGCHFVEGNYRATKRVAYAKKMLEQIGIDPGRVEMYYNSASMGPQFAQTCHDFTQRIRTLGPVYGNEKTTDKKA